MKTRSYWLRETLKMAIENVKRGGGPFAAIIIKNGKIVGSGVNRVTANNDPTAHAEVQAIRDACKNLNTVQLTGCELYTSCEPCPMCFGAIYWARPDRVYFGADKQDAADIGFDDSFIYQELEDYTRLGALGQSIPFIQIRTRARIKPFEFWIQKKDKTKY